MYRRAILFTCVISIILSGCSSTDSANQVGGKLIGGAAGALIGSQFGGGHGRLATVAVGTMLGAHFGGVVGKKMDEKDRQLANSTTQRALESTPDSQIVKWKNPNNDHHGNIKVVSTKEIPEKRQVCRDYVQTVIIDGNEEKIHGRACRYIQDREAQWFVQ